MDSVGTHSRKAKACSFRSLPKIEFAVDLRNAGGVRVAVSDSAHVDATLNLEEALVTPLGAPGVLHNPVVQARGSIVSIANGKNGVVHIHGAILASGGGIDSACVVTEVINDLESD